jgi:5-methylcytosine-specific restriction endonuclease McrA
MPTSTSGMGEGLCTDLVRKRALSWNEFLHPDTEFLPCECCGQWKPTERHHRQFRSRGGLWVPSNIVLLCHDCHEGATDEAPWVSGSGLNVHVWEEPTEVPVRLWYAGRVLLDDDGGYTGVAG